jgi:hypothetical protein
MFSNIFIALLLAVSAAAAPASTESHVVDTVHPEQSDLHTGPFANVTRRSGTSSIWSGGIMSNYPAVSLGLDNQSSDTCADF